MSGGFIPEKLNSQHKQRTVVEARYALVTEKRCRQAAMRACDHWGDSPAAREQMLLDCINTPPGERADLTAHLKSSYRKKP